MVKESRGWEFFFPRISKGWKLSWAATPGRNLSIDLTSSSCSWSWEGHGLSRGLDDSLYGMKILGGLMTAPYNSACPQ